MCPMSIFFLDPSDEYWVNNSQKEKKNYSPFISSDVLSKKCDNKKVETKQ